MGSFGYVFKGILFKGTLVVVKVLNLQLEGAFKSFDAECKVLARFDIAIWLKSYAHAPTP